MQHLDWTRYGRRFHHQDEGKPNTFTLTTKIGEVNVDVHGDGSSFAPYVLAGASLRHGDSECVFSDGWQEIKRLSQTLVSKSRLYVQRNIAGTWTDVPHGVPTRNVAHDYPSEGRCTAYLDFNGIQGYAAGARLQVGVEVGGGDRQTYGFRFRSPVAGTFRLEWVLEIPEDAALAWIETPTSHTDPTPIRVGGRIGQTTIRWSRAEAPLRSATVEIDGQGGRILHVWIGPYTVAAMEWLTIYPDTWGPTNIAADADDGDEAEVGTWNPNGYYAGLIQLEAYPAWTIRWAGFRWNVTLPAGITSIDAGTKIALPFVNDNLTPEFCHWRCRAVESAAPAVWSTTSPGAVADWTEASTTGVGAAAAQDVDVQAIISELVVTNGYNYASGAYMNFGLQGETADDGFWWTVANDYGSGTTAALSITYTAGGGVTLTRFLSILGTGT
jgi:hypothetical protein